MLATIAIIVAAGVAALVLYTIIDTALLHRRETAEAAAERRDLIERRRRERLARAAELEGTPDTPERAKQREIADRLDKIAAARSGPEAATFAAKAAEIRSRLPVAGDPAEAARLRALQANVDALIRGDYRS